MQLLPPIVSRVLIAADAQGNFPTLPSFLPINGGKYKYVTSITITPQATYTAADYPIKTSIVGPANGLTPVNGVCTLQMNNMGRSPMQPVDPNVDLRPCTFIVWGVGKQRFRVFNSRNSGVYQEINEVF
jgi:hypothetical protein